jgi:16S rRNA (guanine527-N7)-methyltransferase
VEHAGHLAEYLSQSAQAVSIPISPQQSAQFIQFAQALRAWNRTVNLTAIEHPREVVVKHFIDSIIPLQFGLLTGQESILDIGTGAGFPSIPLKIMRPDLRMVLLEPNSKKVSFLLYLVGTLELKNVRVVNKTLEQFADTAADRFDYVLIRALGLDTWNGHSASLLTQGGMVLAYRSKSMELRDVPAGLSVQNTWNYELPFGHGSRALVSLGRHGDVPRGTRGDSIVE